jgi:hypothetical protein
MEKLITLAEVQQNALMFGEKRKPSSREDFGDKATIGFKLRKIDYETELKKDGNAMVWGVFYGYYKEQWHVGGMETLTFTPSKLITYDTLEELQSIWELD